MAKEDLAKLSIEDLKKRKTFFGFVLGVLLGLLLVGFVAAFMAGNTALSFAFVALSGTGIPVVLVLQKIKQEIRSRAEK